ncbi:MAG: hypothetical protein ACRCWR_02800 [Saezia sp.]
MTKKKTPENAGQTPLHSLFHYQKRKTQVFLRWLTIVAIVLCLIAAGLGSVWYFKSSWTALVFSVIFAAMGLGLSGIAFFIGEKIELFNTAASGALNIYDLAQKKSTIIDIEAETKTQQTTVEIKAVEDLSANLSNPDAAPPHLKTERS